LLLHVRPPTPACRRDELSALAGEFLKGEPCADRAFVQDVLPRQEGAGYRLRQNGDRAVAVGDMDQKPMVMPMLSTG